MLEHHLSRSAARLTAICPEPRDYDLKTNALSAYDKSSISEGRCDKSSSLASRAHFEERVPGTLNILELKLQRNAAINGQTGLLVRTSFDYASIESRK